MSEYVAPSEEEIKEKVKKSKGSKGKKGENRIKKPRTGFFFGLERRSKLKEKYPDLLSLTFPLVSP
jgi:hypothetical protein